MFGTVAHTMLSQCKASSSSTNAPVEGHEEEHKCPNQLCQCQFVGIWHLKIHLAKTKACTDALFWMVNNHDGSLDVSSDHNEQGGNEL
jgi:hypothetical protein